MPEFSVVTIVKGRRKQLANLLDSIKKAHVLPTDIQVVCMDDPSDIAMLPDENVHIFSLESSDGLPLAAARNAGFAAAQTDNVIFVDVDCIVSPSLFENMLAVLTPDTIVSAYPMYLPVVPESGDFAGLRSQAVPHPNREALPTDEPVDHLQFWSLIFAVRKPTFTHVGGFDESFTGYGAEDTDFAMSFHQAGCKLRFVGDYVLHQYHEKYDPPLNHFDAVIQNAERYKVKWGELPMGGWLKKFCDMGLITIGPDDDVSIIRQPSAAERKKSISKNPY